MAIRVIEEDCRQRICVIRIYRWVEDFVLVSEQGAILVKAVLYRSRARFR